MKILKFIAFIGIATFLSCGGGGDDDAPEVVDPVERVPEKANLIFPENNEECIAGIQSNETESVVNFNWSAATNASTYEVVVENLLDGGQISNTVSRTNVDVLIKMNTPYKWYVVSRSGSSSVRAKSDEWRFYNSGPTITSYAPFPAEVVSPVSGSNINAASVNLDWETTDVDGDLSKFDVYLGTVNPPVDKLGEVTESFINEVSVSPNTYYWMVKSYDDEGNSSTSEVFEFRIVN